MKAQPTHAVATAQLPARVRTARATTIAPTATPSAPLVVEFTTVRRASARGVLQRGVTMRVDVVSKLSNER